MVCYSLPNFFVYLEHKKGDIFVCFENKHTMFSYFSIFPLSHFAHLCTSPDSYTTAHVLSLFCYVFDLKNVESCMDINFVYNETVELVVSIFVLGKLVVLPLKKDMIKEKLLQYFSVNVGGFCFKYEVISMGQICAMEVSPTNGEKAIRVLLVHAESIFANKTSTSDISLFPTLNDVMKASFPQYYVHSINYLEV